MQLPSGLEDRQKYSQQRMNALKESVSSEPELTSLKELCIYVTGSYGRGDASTNSDVDVFFVHLGSEEANAVPRVDKALADAALIKICRKLEFPEFTKGGIYLDIHYLDDIRRHLGSAEDDARNLFTARMLLLLESICILNERVYGQVVANILDTYYRDFLDHQNTFRPLFLVNDILRYWKTMCLNYEARRTGKLDTDEGATSELRKNFKLKYSRLLICFSMIAPLIASGDGITKDATVQFVSLRPFERLMSCAHDGRSKDILAKLLREYEWFLSETSDETQLIKAFGEKQRRQEYFARASGFGDLMYQFLDAVKAEPNAMRYLIV